MLAIQSILHPTDFSEHSDAAFRVACALARDYGARLIVLHIAALPAATDAQIGAAQLPPDYFDSLKAELHKIQAPDPNVQLEHRFAAGNPTEGILEQARESACDLIVLGSHGRTGLGRLLMGSVAESVVRNAACAVLTVKTPIPETSA